LVLRWPIIAYPAAPIAGPGGAAMATSAIAAEPDASTRSPAGRGMPLPGAGKPVEAPALAVAATADCLHHSIPAGPMLTSGGWRPSSSTAAAACWRGASGGCGLHDVGQTRT